MDVTYTGDTPIVHPGLGLDWQPGETKDLTDDLAARLIGAGPFVAADHPVASIAPDPAPEPEPEPAPAQDA